jgi:hypothetical protein
MRITSQITTALALAILMIFAAVPDALAGGFGGGGGGGALFGRASSVINEAYRFGVNIIYVVGGIGLLVMAVFAFVGRFKWGHFFALAGGLFLVAATDLLIQYLTGGSVSGTGATGFGAGLR